MECIVCGGTNFTKESGFYFCTECQTQSQEVKEHEFQEETTQVNTKSTKKIKNTKPSRTEHITSWECYNIILLSLTEELINLGAGRAIKKVVKCLWMKYLEKLEVINLERDQIPKLPLINIKKDLRITYGVKTRKRKRRKSSSESSFTESTSRRERSRKKTALAKTEYSEISSKTEDTSLHNETLTSLKSASEKSETSEKITFNKYSIRELKKRMSRRHLGNHETDLCSNLSCHRFTYSSCSPRYKNGVYFISPIKIYSILYISLLITKDSIQLGDLLRFLREGHLNFNRFTLLFPEGYSNKSLNIHNNSRKTLLSPMYFRETVMKLAQFLDVQRYMKSPNLIELAKRYCKELNLPAVVFKAARNIISRNPMKFGKHRRKPCVANYEARVMSIIIFVLKLLFGLDGVTETKLSDYAEILNTKFNLKMFNIKKWMEFISYRNLVVSENHFPTYNLENSDMNTDLFLQYKLSHNVLADENSKLISDMIGYKDLLSKIKNLQCDYITHIEYPANLKPFSTYTDIITNLSDTNEVLKRNFKDNSLDFILNPLKYLFQVNKNISFKHGGANDNWKMEVMKSFNELLYHVEKKDRNFVPAEIIVHDNHIENKRPADKTKTINIPQMQNDYEKYHSAQFKCNMDRLNQIYRENSKEKLVSESSTTTNTFYDTHFNPYERHWLYLIAGIDLVGKGILSKFLDNFSDSFKLILKESARVIDQSSEDLYIEFQGTELYLTFCGDYKDAPKRRKFSRLKHYARQAENCW